MSDTPETDAQELVHSVSGSSLHCVDVDFARKLERERDKAQEELQEWKDGAYAAEHPCPDEVHCTCVPLLLSKIAALRKERDEQTAQMCQAIGYLSTIAGDCEAWLNGESDEPSMEFIKLVAKYAREAAYA